MKTVLAVFIFYCAAFSADPVGLKPACSKWVDSLVAAGKRSLDSHNVDNARRYFTAAYKCGMSRDSMCYFAAELYIQSFAADTAMTFNWALEKNGRFKRELYLEQRARIFRMIGWKHQADSLIGIIQKKDRHDISLNLHGSRSTMVLNPLTLAPQHNILAIDSIIGRDYDDIGHGNFSYQWSRATNTWLKRLSLALDVETEMGIPRTITRDTVEESDTIIQTIGFRVGLGDFPLTPSVMIGHRMGMHPDGKIDHFSNLNFTYPIGIKQFLAIRHETKWTDDDGIDKSGVQLTYSQLSLGNKISHFGSLTAACNYSKSTLYQDKLGTAGIYRPIPIGYIDKPIDSIQDKEKYRYHRNINDTAMVDIDDWGIYDYWSTQPGLNLVTFPEYDISLALGSTLRISLPHRISVIFMQSIQGVWFPKKLQWYSFDAANENDADLIAKINDASSYSNYAIVYNAADGKCYLNTQRGNRQYYKNSFKEIALIGHKKTRIDCIVSLSAGLEKEIGKIGKLYASSTYLKSFSTLTKNDPIITLNHYWELQAGWKKDLSFTR